MTNKIYTAQEMRDMAENITRVDVMDGLTCREHCYPVKQEVKSMLRQAADMVERCEKVIAECNKAKDMSSSTWSFDKQAFAMESIRDNQIHSSRRRGEGGEMSLDVAIQTFHSQKDTVLWRSLDDYGIVKYYYAEDCVYVLELGMTYAFVKAKSPRLAWRKYCKARDEELGIKKGSNND